MVCPAAEWRSPPLHRRNLTRQAPRRAQRPAIRRGREISLAPETIQMNKPKVIYRVLVSGPTFSSNEEFGENILAALAARNALGDKVSARLEYSTAEGEWHPILNPDTKGAPEGEI
jgi:hypothetical protein